MPSLLVSIGQLVVVLELYLLIFCPMVFLAIAWSIRASLRRIACALESAQQLTLAAQSAAPGAPPSPANPTPRRIGLSQFGR